MELTGRIRWLALAMPVALAAAASLVRPALPGVLAAGLAVGGAVGAAVGVADGPAVGTVVGTVEGSGVRDGSRVADGVEVQAPTRTAKASVAMARRARWAGRRASTRNSGRGRKCRTPGLRG